MNWWIIQIGENATHEAGAEETILHLRLCKGDFVTGARDTIRLSQQMWWQSTCRRLPEPHSFTVHIPQFTLKNWHWSFLLLFRYWSSCLPACLLACLHPVAYPLSWIMKCSTCFPTVDECNLLTTPYAMPFCQPPPETRPTHPNSSLGHAACFLNGRLPFVKHLEFQQFTAISKQSSCKSTLNMAKNVGILGIEIYFPKRVSFWGFFVLAFLCLLW